MVPALVDKCLGSARAGTKSKAIELILRYIEVENNGEGVVVSFITSRLVRHEGPDSTVTPSSATFYLV